MGVATGVAIVGAGASAYTAINEAKKKREAAKALENLDTPELKNTAENLQVSTLSADLQKEEQARLAATQTEALREAGTRGVIGGSGRVEANNQRLNREIGADLDQQQKNIDQLRSQDDISIRGLKESRHSADVAALSSQYNAAAQAQNQAMGNIISSTGTAVNAYQNRSAKPKSNNLTEAPLYEDPDYSNKKRDRIDTRFNY